MSERVILTRQALDEVLSSVSFAPSAVAPCAAGYAVAELPDAAGWLVRFTCVRPDAITGAMGEGHGRWELIERGTTESGAVKTAWLCFELYIRHETMEAFLYQGRRIFDPHKTVDALAHEAREVRS